MPTPALPFAIPGQEFRLALPYTPGDGRLVLPAGAAAKLAAQLAAQGGPALSPAVPAYVTVQPDSQVNANGLLIAYAGREYRVTAVNSNVTLGGVVYDTLTVTPVTTPDGPFAAGDRLIFNAAQYHNDVVAQVLAVAAAVAANTSAIALTEQTANKGVAGGYAGLDGTGKVPTGQLPPLGTVGALVAANNLADVPLPATARTSLGLGSSATHAATDFLAPAGSGAALTGITPGQVGALAAASNLADVASAATARTNLGLGTSATHAAGDFAAVANNLADLASAPSARTSLGLGTIATHAAGDFVAAAGDASATTSTGGRTNEVARSLAARLTDRVNIRDFQTIGNGIADDTAYLQNALNKFSGLGVSGEIELPVGTFLINAPLLLKGMQNQSVRLRGHTSSAGPSGTRIKYGGAAGDLCCLEIRGGCDVTIEGITFDGNLLAQMPLYIHDDIEVTPQNPTPRGVSASNITVRDVCVVFPLPGDSVSMPAGGLSAAISLGVGSNGVASVSQCDGIKLDRVKCVSTQDAHTATCGVATGWGNTKNFTIINPLLSGFQYLVKFGTSSAGSGTLTVIGGEGGGAQNADFYCQSGNMTVIGWESEGSARLLQPAGVVSSVGQITFLGCVWEGNCPDDLIIRTQISLRLIANRFTNNRTGTSVPRVYVGGTGGTTNTNSSMATLVSEGNYYRNATALGADAGGLAVFNGGGAIDLFLKSDDANYMNRSAWCRSFGDIGGTEGSLVQMVNRGSGSEPKTVRLVTSAYLIVWDDRTVLADCTGGTFAITLPPLAQTEAGVSYTVVNWGTANAPTVSTSGSDVIAGTYSLASQYNAVKFKAMKPHVSAASFRWLATAGD